MDVFLLPFFVFSYREKVELFHYQCCSNIMDYIGILTLRLAVKRWQRSLETLHVPSGGCLMMKGLRRF